MADDFDHANKPASNLTEVRSDQQVNTGKPKNSERKSDSLTNYNLRHRVVFEVTSVYDV